MPEFKRTNQESYGISTIRLEKLDMTKGFEELEINGIKIVLPVLNLKNYSSTPECYAFIERFYSYPIIMVDVLYTSSDISDLFEKDEDFRTDFSKKFSRRNITSQNLKSSALTFLFNGDEVDFGNAFKLALQDSVGTQIWRSSNRVSEEVKIKDAQASQEVKEDPLIVEFIKDFYEAISKTKIRRLTDIKEKEKTVIYSMAKEAIFMKSGATIIGFEEVSKYFVGYQTVVKTEKTKQIKDRLSIHISGVDERALVSSEKYRNSFGEVLLESNLLEVLSSINPSRLPILAYAGQYNEEKNKMDVNRRLERYFDEINEVLLCGRASDGR